MENFRLQITQTPFFILGFILFFPCSINSPNLALYIIFDVVAPLVSTFNLSAQFLLTGTLFISLYFQRIGIVQCFVFLGFLSLLENFGLVTPIPVGIRVLGVETPL